jgi:hypothetical protein
MIFIVYSNPHAWRRSESFNKNPGRGENFCERAEEAGYSFVLEESRLASIETSYSERRERDEVGSVGLLMEWQIEGYRVVSMFAFVERMP